MSEYDRPGLDDPLWEYTLRTRLMPYIPYVRTWWQHALDVTVKDTGSYSIPTTDEAPGLMFRFTRTAKRSPIKDIQVFPYVPTAYLQLIHIQGGANKMVARVCKDGLFCIDEFTIIERHNLPTTYQQGQFVAFIPTTLHIDINTLGQWVYLTMHDMESLVKGHIPKTLIDKVILRL